MLGALAALLSGCAASSADGFNENAANGVSHDNSIGSSARVTSTNAATPFRNSSFSGGAGASAVEIGSVATTTSSLQTSAAALSAPGTPGASAYKIGPHDVIEVSVFKVPELSKSVQVSEAGTINLPLVGEVGAAGKTARDVERDLTRSLGAKYLQNPQVTIFIKEYNSQRITVEGAVRKPGVFPIQGNMSLLQAVAMAQGLDDVSDHTVLIFRGKKGARKAARFDISDIRTGEAEDPQLMAGDVVVAGTSALKESFNGFLKALPITGLFALL